MTRRNYIVAGLIGLALVIAVAAFLWWRLRPVGTGVPANYAEASRDALVVADDPYGDVAESIVYLDQGWTPRDSMDFYTRTQGSRLVPYSWFLHLEQPANERPFREPANITRLRYLPQKANVANPDGLPVGFVKDPRRSDKDVEWLGLTCAACHTTQVNYNKIGFRIDGGPAMGDQETFLQELTLALNNTLEDQAQFGRFAGKVLGEGASAADRDVLKQQLRNVAQFRKEFEGRNRPPHPSGFARLDAFGRILNEVLVHDLGVTAPEQTKVPNAPVSYPFLWDTPQHDFVQWNGIAANKVGGSTTLGALTRNVGEVLGVFGEVNIREPGAAGGPLIGYDSSIRVTDLVQTEQLLRKLQSPLWPKELPPIEDGKKMAGEKLFGTFCRRCHEDREDKFDRKDPNRAVKAQLIKLSELGTDPGMAVNFANRRGKTGKLEGRKSAVVKGAPFGKEAGGDEVLTHVVLGIILNTAFSDYAQSDLLRVRRPGGVFAEPPPPGSLVYKARPLNGIWATAPYLHNGSVPSLYQLLLPAEERMPEFYVGRRELDPKNVGFKTDKFEGGYLFRTTGPGNSNAGHEYGTGKKKEMGGDGLRPLTPEERWQLVEYMKSL